MSISLYLSVSWGLYLCRCNTKSCVQVGLTSTGHSASVVRDGMEEPLINRALKAASDALRQIQYPRVPHLPTVSKFHS